MLSPDSESARGGPSESLNDTVKRTINKELYVKGRQQT
jgi:hypothetical protein